MPVKMIATPPRRPRRRPCPTAAGARSPRQASAMTSALSPDSSTLIQMILPTATQNGAAAFRFELGEERADGGRIEDLQASPQLTPSQAGCAAAAVAVDQPTISLPEKNCAISIAAVSAHPSRAPSFRRSISASTCGSCRRRPSPDRSRPSRRGISRWRPRLPAPARRPGRRS